MGGSKHQLGQRLIDMDLWTVSNTSQITTSLEEHVRHYQTLARDECPQKERQWGPVGNVLRPGALPSKLAFGLNISHNQGRLSEGHKL